MKKVIASVLSLVLVLSAAAAVQTGPVSADYYSNDYVYQDENITAEVTDSYYENVFDEEQGRYINWYSLAHFDSNLPAAYIPQEVKGKTIFNLNYHSCSCKNVDSLVLPKKVKVIAQDALYDTDSLKYLTVGENVIDLGEQSFSPDLTIRGYIGSYAQKYAKKNGYDFQMIGDCDGNGTISASDILKIKNYLLNNGAAMTDDQLVLSDYNLDSKINIIDFIYDINNLLSDKTDFSSDPNKSAVAAPDYSQTLRTTNYKNESFNDFTAKTINAMFKENDTQNEVCSPISLYMALSQAAECSDGETQKEFLDVLGAENLEELRTDNSSLFNSLYYDELSRYMKLANSVWINDKYTLEQDPLDKLAKDYFSAVFSENFSESSEVSDKINNWISDNTGGKFNPQIDVDPEEDIMKIINTVNFKDAWSDKFSTPCDDTFTKKDGTQETSKFLKETYVENTVGFGDDYMKFSVSMRDRFEMNFILPDEDCSVNEIVTDQDTLNEIIDDTMTKQQVKVNFSVPVFDVKSKYDFSGTARELGIRKAFDSSSADFSRAIDPLKNNGTGAYISSIIHEAGISINEQGCEAAAYTVIQLAPSCAPDPTQIKEVDFDLDRPFIYYVSDNNGTPVFMGIINDPLQK